MHLLQAPAVGDESSREPVEQLRVCGPAPHHAKVARTWLANPAPKCHCQTRLTITRAVERIVRARSASRASAERERSSADLAADRRPSARQHARKAGGHVSGPAAEIAAQVQVTRPRRLPVARPGPAAARAAAAAARSLSTKAACSPRSASVNSASICSFVGRSSGFLSRNRLRPSSSSSRRRSSRLWSADRPAVSGRSRAPPLRRLRESDDRERCRPIRRKPAAGRSRTG